MSPTAGEPAGRYWSRASLRGISTTLSFEGSNGLKRLGTPGEYSTDPTAYFRATLARVQLDHVAIEGLEASPHRWRREREQIKSDPTPLLTVIFLTAGILEIEMLGEASFVLHPNEVALFDSRHPKSYSARESVKMIRSVVGLEHIPTTLQQRGTVFTQALPLTPLIASHFGLTSTILRVTAIDQIMQGEQLIRPIAELQSAVLAEAQQRQGDPGGPSGIRYRIEEHIEAHYPDPALDPSMIAEALQISVRTVHAVFDDGERTVARFIRERRLDAVALELRTAPRGSTLDDLALRNGFSSADVLGRAFRERFAMTPTDYRNGAHRVFE